MINGVLAVIDDPQITNNQLMKYIPGPDFPTGGQIFGRDGIISAYNTGKGRVILRSRYHIETSAVRPLSSMKFRTAWSRLIW